MPSTTKVHQTGAHAHVTFTNIAKFLSSKQECKCSKNVVETPVLLKFVTTSLVHELLVWDTLPTGKAKTAKLHLRICEGFVTCMETSVHEQWIQGIWVYMVLLELVELIWDEELRQDLPICLEMYLFGLQKPLAAYLKCISTHVSIEFRESSHLPAAWFDIRFSVICNQSKNHPYACTWAGTLANGRAPFPPPGGICFVTSILIVAKIQILSSICNQTCTLRTLCSLWMLSRCSRET